MAGYDELLTEERPSAGYDAELSGAEKPQPKTPEVPSVVRLPEPYDIKLQPPKTVYELTGNGEIIGIEYPKSGPGSWTPSKKEREKNWEKLKKSAKSLGMDLTTEPAALPKPGTTLLNPTDSFAGQEEKFLPINQMPKEEGLKDVLSALPEQYIKGELPGQKEAKTLISKIPGAEEFGKGVEQGAIKDAGISRQLGAVAQMLPGVGMVESGEMAAAKLVGKMPGVRSFIETVGESKITDPKVVEKLSSEFYKVRNTAEGMAKADMIVKNFPYQAKAMITGNKIDDAGAFISQALIKQAQNAGNYDEAVNLTKELARKATESGRFSQALSAYNRLTPEGILRYAQSVVDEANKIRPDLKLFIKPDDAKKFVNSATELGKMAEGTAKQKATQKLLGDILAVVPPTVGQKIATVQTMAQLLNPKTIIRNVVGNTLFGGVENLNQAVVATPVDKLLSLVTGKRTTLLPSMKTQAKGFVAGAKEGFEEAVSGVPAKVGTQFELSRIPVFRDKILGTLEKTMNVVLRAPDRAAYKAAFDDSIRQQMQIAKVANPTNEMIEQAHQSGLYRTFQDENVVSGLFVGLKRALNTGWTPQRGTFTMNFGLGDVILKYPKTPGNLLARSIDYSPLGIVDSIFGAARGLKAGEFNQKAFVDSFSRGITGTAGIAGAAVLAKLGIISALPSKDRDVRELERLSGEGAYQINASALYRFVQSGLLPQAAKKREGDTLLTYDWAQPVATNIALGAKFADSKNPQKTAMDIGDVLTTGTETLAEQPLVSGMRRFFGGYKPGDAVADALKSIPASFTPTLLKQMAQTVDPTQRQTRSDEMFGFKDALNRVIAKIPVLSKTLPVRRDIFGKEAVAFQRGEGAGLGPESANLFNIFLNPAFISKYKPNKEAQEVIRLMENTGETRHFPKYVSPAIIVGRGSIKMTPDQQGRYQKIVGMVGQKVINQLIENPGYQKIPDEEKVKEILTVLTEINKQVKTRMVAEVYWDNIKKLPKEKQIDYLKNKEKLKMLTPEIFNQIIELKKQP